MNNTWLQIYCADLGLEHLIEVGQPWSCTVCLEAVSGLTDHCGITAVGHLKTILEWLTELMFDSRSNYTSWDELDFCEPGFVFKQLCMGQFQEK